MFNEYPKRASAPETLWVTEKQAAARLNMSVKWLQKRRLSGEPPIYAKFGGAVRYSVASIEEYEFSCVRRSTSDIPRSVD